jgi:nicotinate-nucleotide adenylyltransferase
MKLGLYGGAFNPIHRCHLVVADAARSRLGLDTVLFIPTGDPPHKLSSEFFPATNRMEMVKLAIAPYPYFQVSDIELRRSAKSYSIDTVRELKTLSPPDTEFVFIIGLDAFLELPTWKDPEALLAACDFAVVSRPGTRFRALETCAFLMAPDRALLDELDAAVGSGGGSSRTGPPPTMRVTVGRLPLTSGRTLWAIPIPPCEVAAKDIRERLRKRQDLENSLPAPVESYILQMNITDQ